MNKHHYNLIPIIAILCLFMMSSVYASWTYYTGIATADSEPIPIKLGKFYYPQKIHDGFTPDYDGNVNSSTLDKIIDEETGINNPDNDLNIILQSYDKFPSSGFVTSIDKKNLTTYEVEQIKKTLGIEDGAHFLIHRVSDTGITQRWQIYTTNFPIEEITQEEIINSKGEVETYFSQQYIYDVYRSDVTWYTNFDDTGRYVYDDVKVDQTVKGYATPQINAFNNNEQPFFSPDTFVPTPFVKCKSITINGPSSMYIDENVRLNAVFEPENPTEKDIIWSSNNNSIASIEKDGTIKAKKAGKVTITAKSRDSTVRPVYFDLEVKVKDNSVLPEQIEIVHDSIYNSFVMGQDIQLRANVYPNNASNKNVVWSTSDESIGSINKDGVLTVHDGYNSTKLTIYAHSEIDENIVAQLSVDIQLPHSNYLINGDYKVNQDKTLRYYNAREIGLDQTYYVYPDLTHNQALKFTIKKAETPLKLKVTFKSSDANAKIIALNYMDEDTKLYDYPYDGSNEFTLSGTNYTDMTYFINVSGNSPVEISLTTIK